MQANFKYSPSNDELLQEALAVLCHQVGGLGGTTPRTHDFSALEQSWASHALAAGIAISLCGLRGGAPNQQVLDATLRDLDDQDL